MTTLSSPPLFARFLANVVAFGILAATAYGVSYGFERFSPDAGPRLALTRQELAGIGGGLMARVQALLPDHPGFQPRPATEAQPIPVPDTSARSAETFAIASTPHTSYKRVLALANAHAQETVLSNVSARDGGTITFSDGSSITIPAHALARNSFVDAALCLGGTPENRSLHVIGRVLRLRFRPVLDGVEYASKPQISEAAVRLHLESPVSGGVLLIERIIMPTGVSTAFPVTPMIDDSNAAGELGSTRLLSFAARYHGTLLFSLQAKRG